VGGRLPAYWFCSPKWKWRIGGNPPAAIGPDDMVYACLGRSVRLCLMGMATLNWDSSWATLADSTRHSTSALPASVVKPDSRSPLSTLGESRPGCCDPGCRRGCYRWPQQLQSLVLVGIGSGLVAGGSSRGCAACVSIAVGWIQANRFVQIGDGAPVLVGLQGCKSARAQRRRQVRVNLQGRRQSLNCLHVASVRDEPLSLG